MKTEYEREIKELQDKLECMKRGELKLNSSQVWSIKNSISRRQQRLETQQVKKLPLEKRIPLYRRGELWICGQCYFFQLAAP
jgi:hypothetical protein